MGASPLVNPWWLFVSENIPDDFLGEHPRRWVTWSVTLQEFDPDEGVEIPGHIVITHEKIIKALQHILEHHDDFVLELWENAMNLYHGNVDDVDFDSDTADQILQLIAFDEVKYG
jgi:hypothetical protein